MPIWSVVTQEEILNTLNVACRYTEDQFADFLVSRSMAGPTTTQEEDWARSVSVSCYLRCRVDEWLRTGVNPDGSESPYSRDRYRAKAAYWAAQLYVEKYRVEMISHPGLPGMTIMAGDVPRSSGKWLDFFMEALEEADRLLAGLLASDWKELLGKCRYRLCGRYFLLKRPRASYRHGMFCCRQHQNLVCGGTCTAKRRAWAKDKLIEFAARQLVDWGFNDARWQDNPAQKRYLATALSQRISRDPNLQGYRQQLKVNWVTRHQSEIEQKRYELNPKYPAPDVVGRKREVQSQRPGVDGLTDDSESYPGRFPRAPARAIIKHCSRPGDTVLDLFGALSTSVAVEGVAHGRNVLIIRDTPTQNQGKKSQAEKVECPET